MEGSPAEGWIVLKKVIRDWFGARGLKGLTGFRYYRTIYTKIRVTRSASITELRKNTPLGWYISVKVFILPPLLNSKGKCLIKVYR